MSYEKKPKKPTFVSPAGVAVYPWVNNPDNSVWNAGQKVGQDPAKGVYKTGLRLTSAEFEGVEYRDGKSFRQWLDELVELSFAEAQAEHPKERKQIKPRPPYKEEVDDQGNETGSFLVSFKQNARINRKDGTVAIVTIPIFDATGAPTDASLFGGSTIKVAFTIRNTWLQASKEAGIRLDMNAVQAIKIVRSEKSATDFGFGQEDAGEDEGGAQSISLSPAGMGTNDEPTDF